MASAQKATFTSAFRTIQKGGNIFEASAKWFGGLRTAPTHHPAFRFAQFLFGMVFPFINTPLMIADRAMQFTPVNTLALAMQQLFGGIRGAWTGAMDGFAYETKAAAFIRDMSRRKAVRAAIERLPVDQRKVVIAHYSKNLEVDEMAASLKTTPEVIQSHLAEGRTKLLESLRANITEDNEEVSIREDGFLGFAKRGLLGFKDGALTIQGPPPIESSRRPTWALLGR